MTRLPPHPETSLREWLAEGDFTLAMSSGFFGFFAHTGTLLALEESGLLPSAVSGSSAGGLVAGLWAAGVDGPTARQELIALQRGEFWDPAPGLGLLRGRRFRRLLEQLLPVPSFAECRVPLRVSVYDVLTRRTRSLDSGLLAPAIHASCAVPFMFHPVWIDGRPLLDGGISDRPGVVGLAPGERLLLSHLSSKSPWRIAQPRPPLAPGRVALEITGLPRLGPFRLKRGPRALDLAYRATLRALQLPVETGHLCLPAS